MKHLSFPKRMGFLLLLFVIFLLPLSAQDTDETDWDDLSIMEGEGITVTGTTETTQEIKVVDKAEIERRNAPDLATLLQETMDIGFTRYGGYGNQGGINIRGFDSKRLAFLIDGVPVNSSNTGDFDLSQIDLNSVERIEVIYGGSDTKYNVSGSLGGVINIITAKDQKPGLRFGGSFANTGFLPGEYRNFNMEKESPHGEDLLDTQNFSLFGSYGAKQFSLKLNGFFNRVGNHFLFKDRTFETTRRKVNNEVYDGGVSGSFIWNLPEAAKIIAAADLYYGDKNIPTSGNSPIKGVQTDFSTRQSLMLDMPVAYFNENFAVEGSLTHRWQILQYERGPTSKHDEHLLTAINRWTWYAKDFLTLRFGGDYRFITLNSTDMGNRNRHDGGLYLTGESQVHSMVLIIPSIKAVFCSSGSQPVTAIPKLGIAFKPLDSLTVKNNYFRSFK